MSWCVCAVFITSASAALADTNTQSMVYEVYAGGIHAVQATLDINIDEDTNNKYDIILEARTRGFLDKLVPWNGAFETSGWMIGGDDLRPEQHRSVSVWRGEEEIKEYNYGQDRAFKGLRIKDPDKPIYDKKVDDALTQGTTDVLTATLIALRHAGNDETCKGTSEIFDGKRRFYLKFNHVKTEELERSKYNVYEGKALRCTVEVKPIAGEWHKKPRGWMSIQEQGRERGTMPTVWMGTLQEGGPSVPVKIMVKTQYGALIMHLVEYQGRSQKLTAEKRAERQ